MAYAQQKKALGSVPISVVDLDIDYCSLTYGSLPCTASAAAGSECYNTRIACQDVANFNKGIKTYRFCQAMQGLPIDIDMIPALDSSPVFTPGKITPGKGLGYRASISVRIRDFPYHDRGIDKYASTRNYTPEDQGTFWGKFLARNPYYNDRIMRVRSGYLTDPWDWSNFQDHTYVITDIKGPDKNGYVTITGKDVLTLADDKKSQCPVASKGKLLAAITTASTSLTLDPAGIGNSEYPASGTIRIGREEMTFTRSGDAVTITAHNVNGTELKSHDAGDVVQLCKVFSNTNIVDVIDDLLNNFVDGFDAANWLPYDQGISGPNTGTDDEWDDEKSFYLSSSNVSRTISKPTGVNKLIAEICEQFLLNIFWEQTQQKVKLRAIAPPKANAAILNIDDKSNILKDSVRVTRDDKQRVSQVWIYYSKIDNTESGNPENYHQLGISGDLVSEGEDLYGSKQIKEIFSDWITTVALADQLGGRWLDRFNTSPTIIDFALDAKDADQFPGDLLDIETNYIQSLDGMNAKTRFEILQVDEKMQGHRFEYKAMISSYVGLFGFIGPDTLLDYASETEQNKQQFCFICDDFGFFADGSQGYKII